MTDTPLAKFGTLAAGLAGLLAGTLVLGLTTSPIAGWIGTALVLLGLWGLGGSTVVRTTAQNLVDKVPEVWRGRTLAALPYALVALVVAWVTWPAVIGEVPVSQDHAHHYLQTAIFTDDLVASGHLFGWTHRIGTGLAFGDVYATAVYAVTGFLRIISFGLISRATSYAVGIYFVWLIPAWAIVAWTRRMLADIVDIEWISVASMVVAAGLFAVDIGTDREGGWVYSMFHAVWPQVVGTGMWLWSVLAMVRLLEKPTTRRLGVAAIVAGFTFWAHPMNALNLLITAPLLFVVALANRSDAEDVSPHSSSWWLIPAFALAAVIGYGWISHMMAAGDDISSFTAYGETMRTYALRLLESGVPFEGSTALAALLAGLGLIVAAVRGGVVRHFSVVGLVAFVALASSDVFASTDFGLSEAAPFIMFKRFVITAKPLMFALSGLGLGLVLQQVVRHRERLAPTATALAIAATAPFVYAGLDALPVVIRTPESRFLTAEDAQVEEALGKIVSIIDRELEVTPGPKRVMVWHERGDTGDYALFAIAELGVGYLPTRNPPAHAYANLGLMTDLEGASLLGASHIISRADRKFPGARLLGEYPPYKLWRVNNVPGDGVRLFKTSGLVHTTEWSPMRHVAEVTNSKDKGELIFAIPPHPKWTYWQDGKQLETKPYPFGGRTKLTQVLGFKDGEVIAKYSDTTTEKVAFVLMLLVLLLSIGGIGWNRGLPELPEPWDDRAQLPALAACVALGLATWFAVIQLGESALNDAWAKEPGSRVLEALHRQKPTLEYEPRPFCVRPMSRNPRVDCDESVLEPRLRLSAPRHQRIPACVEFTVPDNGHLELEWDVPAGTDRVKGRFDGRMGSVVPMVMIDGKEKPVRDGTLDAPVEGDKFWMRLDNRNRRTQDVCLEIVAIDDGK